MKNIQALHRQAMLGKNINADVMGQQGLFIRKRFTIAEINAGAVLVPKKQGIRYRVADMAMIAIGGAVTGATTVDILATQAAVAAKLMASAIANLTQNTLLRAGATGGAILAAGVSFVANDVNTDLSVGKTGGAAATATHVDVLVWYVEEVEGA